MQDLIKSLFQFSDILTTRYTHKSIIDNKLDKACLPSFTEGKAVNSSINIRLLYSPKIRSLDNSYFLLSDDVRKFPIIYTSIVLIVIHITFRDM